MHSSKTKENRISIERGLDVEREREMQRIDSQALEVEYLAGRWERR